MFSSTQQTPLCPFYIKCGFCPRQPLCKLQHEATGKDHTHSLPGNSGIHGNSSSLLSPSKRIHLLEKPELTMKIPLKTNSESTSVDYNRSLSSPATVLATFPDNSEPLPQRVATDPIVKDKAQNSNREKAKISDPILLPTTFDFLGGGQSSKGQEVDDEEPVQVKPRGDNDVFVFTASNPSSPDVTPTVSRRKNAAVVYKFPGSGQTEATKIESDEKLAMLTQQLELGSDSVSEVRN